MNTTRMHLVLVFAAGCATTALAGRLTADVRAQTPASGGPGVVEACVAADGVMRIAPAGGTCPAGQQTLFFRKASAAAAPSASASKESTDARVKALEQRIAALERETPTGMSRRVVAPFEVVDSKGKTVLVIGDDHRVLLYNSSEEDVVRLEADAQGGEILARNGSGLAAMIRTTENISTFSFIENGKVRTEMGRNPATGIYRLLFYTTDGQSAVAGMAETPDGGAMYIADNKGIGRAGMQINDRGGGYVSVSNSGRKVVAALTEGKTAGGLLEIMSSGSQRMVVAGVEPGDFGVVQAGPASFQQAAGLGLPGSYIAGKPK